MGVNRRVLAMVAGGALLAGCGGGDAIPASSAATPSASPLGAAASPTPTPSAPHREVRRLELANLGVALDLPDGWQVRTTTLDEIPAIERHRPLDLDLTLRRSFERPLLLSSLGPVGLLAITDEPLALLVVEAYAASRAREEFEPEVALQTPAGPAVGGRADDLAADIDRAVAYVDVPAGDWDLRIAAMTEAGSTADPWALVGSILASLDVMGAPATTQAAAGPALSTAAEPDPMLDRWLPTTLAGARLSGSSISGRSAWLTIPSMSAGPGSILALCATLATGPDEVGVYTGVAAARSGPIVVVGCRVDHATDADWEGAIAATPLAGYDRPVFATGQDGTGRLVVAGQVALGLSGGTGKTLDAAIADLPPDLPPDPER